MKNKRVLVTGAGGFIGSHLAESLIRVGYDVVALCHYNANNHWGWLDESEVKDQLEVILGDVRDPFFCKMATKGVDIVFNLAALIAIPYSYSAPQSYFETNVNGTLNICQACLENEVEQLIQISTSEVYGTARYVPIDETHPLTPQSPYSASKIASDSVSLSYHNSFGLPVTVARPFNTFGPRQSARAIIPTIITQLTVGVEEIKVGDLRPTRDFNFVLDTCNGLISLINNKKAIGQTINIGSGTEISIQGLITEIQKICGTSARITSENARIRPEKSEVFRLVCDNSLIKEITGFSHTFDLQQGLIATIDWFKEDKNLSKFKPGHYNV